MSENRETEYLKIKDIAELAGISETAVYKRIKTGELDKYIKLENGVKTLNREVLEQFNRKRQQTKEKNGFSGNDEVITLLKEQLKVKDGQILNLTEQVKSLEEKLVKFTEQNSELNTELVRLVQQSQELTRNSQILFKSALPGGREKIEDIEAQDVPEQPGGQKQEGAAAADEKQPEAPTKKRKWFWQK